MENLLLLLITVYNFFFSVSQLVIGNLAPIFRIVSDWENQIPSYSERDATFLDLFISTDAVHVSGGRR